MAFPTTEEGLRAQLDVMKAQGASKNQMKIMIDTFIERQKASSESFIGRASQAVVEAPNVSENTQIKASEVQKQLGDRTGIGAPPMSLGEKIRDAVTPDKMPQPQDFIPEVTGNEVVDTLLLPASAPFTLGKNYFGFQKNIAENFVEEGLAGIKNIGSGLFEQGKEMIGMDDDRLSGEGFTKATQGLFQLLSAPIVATAQELPGGDKLLEIMGKVTNAPSELIGFLYEEGLRKNGQNPDEEQYQLAKQQLMDAANVGLMVKGPQIAQGTSKITSFMDQKFTQGIYWLEDSLKKADLPPEVKTGVIKNAQKNIDGLSQIENTNKSVRNFIQDAKSKGIDVKEMIGQSDLLLDSVDTDGTIRTTKTGGAVDQINQLMEPAEGVVSKALAIENKSIPFKDVEAYMKAQVENGDFAGAGLDKALANVDAELKGLTRYVDADGNIPLTDLQKLKVYKNKTINYMNPEVGMVDKTIVRSIKELIEQNTESIDVKAINKELQSLYTAREFLTLLDGKKVKGGKLGKYFAQTVGTVVGAPFGPIGAIFGGELAKYIQGKKMQSTFKSPTGGDLSLSEQMQGAIDQSSKNVGNLNTSQSTMTMNPKASIPETVPQTKPFNKAGSAESATLPKSETGVQLGESKTDMSLIEEAKKYKSAEEFVEAQGTPVFRGGDTPLDTSRGGVKGISVSDKETAGLFTPPKGGVVDEAILPKTAKILKENDIPKNLQDAYIKEAKILANPNNFSTALQKSVIEKQQAIIDYARKNGFDAVEFPFEKEIRIIKPNVLKTKSQLTDIWRKANGK